MAPIPCASCHLGTGMSTQASLLICGVIGMLPVAGMVIHLRNEIRKLFGHSDWFKANAHLSPDTPMYKETVHRMLELNVEGLYSFGTVSTPPIIVAGKQGYSQHSGECYLVIRWHAAIQCRYIFFCCGQLTRRDCHAGSTDVYQSKLDLCQDIPEGAPGRCGDYYNRYNCSIGRKSNSARQSRV